MLARATKEWFVGPGRELLVLVGVYVLLDQFTVGIPRWMFLFVYISSAVTGVALWVSILLRRRYCLRHGLVR